MTTKLRGGGKGLSGRTIKVKTFFAASLSNLMVTEDIDVFKLLVTNYKRMGLVSVSIVTRCYNPGLGDVNLKRFG